MRRKFGWKKDKRDKRDYFYNAPKKLLEKLPDEADASTGITLPVYDQGRLGSCTAQAIAKCYQFLGIRQKTSFWIPSRLFIYFNERLEEGTVQTDSGAMLRDGMKTMARYGVPPEEEWPYDIDLFTNRPPKAAYDHAEQHQLEMYQRVNPTLEQMMCCIAQGFPFVCGIQVYDSFDNDFTTKTGTVVMPHQGWSRWHFGGERLLGGHAIAVYKYSLPQQKFWFWNSYGFAWGNQGGGSIPIPYLTDPELCDDRWTLREAEVSP